MKGEDAFKHLMCSIKNVSVSVTNYVNYVSKLETQMRIIAQTVSEIGTILTECTDFVLIPSNKFSGFAQTY